MRVLELKKKRLVRRKRHIRKSIFGSAERPRMTIFRSLKNMSVQIINDVEGKTLVSASTLDKDLKGNLEGKSKIDQSKMVGELIAKRANAANIKTVVFDRNGNLFHGRVKAIADTARKSGLEF